MSVRIPNYFDFGPYSVDVRQHLLLREGVIVPLAPKPFDALCLFMKSGGQLLDKDRMLTTLWPDTFVEEATLAQNIFVIRKTLGNQDGGRTYIETIPKRGYRFTAIVAGRFDENLAQRNHADTDLRKCSIAVIPLIDVSADGQAVAICDGISERLSDALTLLPAVQVKAFSIVQNFTGGKLDPQILGQQLDVTLILVGKLSTVDDSIRIRVELIDVVNGWQLWTASYHDTLASLTSVEEAIAQGVAAAVYAGLLR